MNKFSGKVVVITGGNSGIGLATAKAFAAQGAKVAIAGRDKPTLNDAAKQIGGEVLAVQTDVSKISEIEAFYRQVGDKFGNIDVLFVNAGVAKFASLAETSEDLLHEIMDINFKGAYFTVQKALPLLNDNASIIFNTSMLYQLGLLTTSVYAASKAALRSLARTFSAELIDRGIRVNAVAPGPIETPIFGRTGMSPEAVNELAAGVLGRVPMKRFGSADEIAKAVLFLASTDSSYVLGVELNVDGGMAQL
ncbi:MAG: SDR family oxidoreductase [Acidobacteria bacterium]|nr:SDR family oxidoreductase [Acidobacteriota bacterium]